MRKGFGICCIVLGVCCLISSLGLIAYNRWEEENAQDVSMNILQDVQENMPEITREESTSEESKQDESEEISVDIPKEMLSRPRSVPKLEYINKNES